MIFFYLNVFSRIEFLTASISVSGSESNSFDLVNRFRVVSKLNRFRVIDILELFLNLFINV